MSMMTSRYRPLLLVCLMLALALSVGCRKATPIYNPTNVELPSHSKRNMAAMTSAIKSACTARGWTASEESRSRIIASHTARGHTAIVNIDYTANSFSISYRDSMNLNYEGATIHKTYNNWVQNLEQEIRIRANNI